jgi:large subunit ribosomal protein L17
MFRNMVTSLLEHERIYTTICKAKEIRRWADWMITLGKRGDLHVRRQAAETIRQKSTVHKLFEELAPRFQNRAGGYTRILKLGYRRGDGSPMCMIELVSDEPRAPKKTKSKPQAEAPAVSPGAEEAQAE